MTVLTVFRSVSDLHNNKQGRAAKGVVAEATVHWTNIITTKGNEGCMRRSTMNESALHRPVAARRMGAVALFCTTSAENEFHRGVCTDVIHQLF